MTELAEVTRLSASTKAIVAFHGSGKVQSLTLVKGRQAFVLDEVEAKKLQAALREPLRVEGAA